MKKMLWLLPFVFSACSVGKKAEDPHLVFEDSYTKTVDEISYVTSENINLSTWWKSFNDETLEALIAKAFEKNFDYKIAIEKIAQTRAEYKLQKAELLPEIEANASAERFKVSETLSDSPFLGAPYQSLFNLGFDASWEIDLFGQQRHAKKAAWFTLLSQQEYARNVKVSLAAEVAKSYVELRYLQKIKKLEEGRKDIFSKMASMSQDRFVAGIDSEKKLIEAKVKVLNASSKIKDLEKAIEQTIFKIADLLGDAPISFDSSPLKMEKRIPIAAGIIKPELPSQLLRRRPDVKSVELKLYAASEQLGYAFAQYFPSFSLTGSWNVSSTSIANLFTPGSINWSLLPSFNLPLIDFGRIRSEVNVAKSEERQALLKYEQVVLNAFKEVEDTLVSYLKKMQKQDFSQESVVKSKSLFDLAKDRYSAGIDSLEPTLNSYEAFLEQKQNLYENEYQLALCVIAFYKAIGGGW